MFANKTMILYNNILITIYSNISFLSNISKITNITNITKITKCIYCDFFATIVVLI